MILHRELGTITSGEDLLPLLLSDPAIEEIDLRGNDRLRTAPELGRFTALRRLSLRRCLAFESIEFAARLPRLEYLDLSRTRVTDLSPLASLQCLGEILYYAPCVEYDYGQYTRLPALRSLGFVADGFLRDIGFLALMPQLEELDLTWTGVSRIDALAGMAGLRSLDLHGTLVASLEPLSGLERLETLCLDKMTQLEDLGPLRGLTGLRTLSLVGAHRVADLTPLRSLKHLETLILGDLPRVASFEVLRELSEVTIIEGVDRPGKASEAEDI